MKFNRIINCLNVNFKTMAIYITLPILKIT
jgi:hypothetical protein